MKTILGRKELREWSEGSGWKYPDPLLVRSALYWADIAARLAVVAILLALVCLGLALHLIPLGCWQR